MDEETIGDFLAAREQAAKHIDPDTAEVYWEYGQVMDPYGIDAELPDELQGVERIYFARSPESEIWVCFDDLPEAVCSALWEKHKRQLAFPAGLPFGTEQA